MRRLLQQVKTALSKNAGVDADGDGYVVWPQDNLVPGVQLTQFEDGLRRGAGCELQMKLCAVHSSSASPEALAQSLVFDLRCYRDPSSGES